MKFFSLSIPRLRAFNTKWRTAFTSLRLVIPPGLGVIHLVALSDGNEDPPQKDIRYCPIGLMQIPRRTGQRLGFKSEDLKKTPNNIYAWAKMTNQDARTLYNINQALWTRPTYDFWLTVHLMFLMQTSFSTLWEYANPTTANTDHIFTLLLGWIAAMDKTSHVGHFQYRDMQILARHLESAQKALIALDGPDHATAAFGSEMSVPSRGSVMTVLQTSAV